MRDSCLNLCSAFIYWKFTFTFSFLLYRVLYLLYMISLNYDTTIYSSAGQLFYYNNLNVSIRCTGCPPLWKMTSVMVVKLNDCVYDNIYTQKESDSLLTVTLSPKYKPLFITGLHLWPFPSICASLPN